MTDIKDFVNIDCDINHVALRKPEGYFVVSCDYGVLADNDFLDVLLECMRPKIDEMLIVFLDFAGINQTVITEMEKVILKGDPKEASEELDRIRRRYISMDGKFSSRYVITNADYDFVIVSEESVPLSKCFFRNEYKNFLEDRLLSQYTY